MKLDILNSKRYNVGNGVYIIISYNDTDRPVEILTSFSFECTLSVKHMIFINSLNSTWSKMLKDGISLIELMNTISLSTALNDEYIGYFISVLEKEIMK